VPVVAPVVKIDSMSAHADRNEILRWLGTLPAAPQRVYLVHGEPEPMDALRELIRERLRWDSRTPTYRETIAV
jgi:metallo-beta-lactamase family protein